MFSMPTFTFWYGANGTCYVILTRRIFFFNSSNYYTFEKSKTSNKIVKIIQQNKRKRNIWHTSDVTEQLTTVAPAEVSQPSSL